MLWTAYPFSLQFRNSVLEKEYLAKVQQGVQNNTRRAGVFIIFFSLCTALLISIVFAGSISSGFLHILESPALVSVSVVLIAMVVYLSWIPTAISEYAITCVMVVFFLALVMINDMWQAGNMPRGKFLQSIIDGVDGNVRFAEYKIKIFHWCVDVQMVLACSSWSIGSWRHLFSSSVV